MKQLGDVLLEQGLITPVQLAEAVAEQRRIGRSLGRVLVDLGLLDEGQLVAALAQQIGLAFVDLTDHPVDGSAVLRVPEQVCRRHVALPIGYDDGRLVVAMADPANVFAVDDVRLDDRHGGQGGRRDPRRRAGRDRPLPPRRRRARRPDDRDGRRPTSRTTSAGSPRSSRTRRSSSSSTCSSPRRSRTARPTSTSSRRRRDLRVRFRIDGVLHEVMRSPRSHRRRASPAASRSWPTSTSPSGASRRTAGCR